LPLKLTKNILDYANHHRDHREMNIIELYQRLEIIKNTNNIKQICQLKISIQERYALPFSCIVFAWLGSTSGITSKPKAKSNSMGLAAIAIFVYYAIQFISNSLAIAQVISAFWGAWLPNLIDFSLGYFFLHRDKIPSIKI
jgi:lipopolysaccharide export system permease protein